MKSNLLLKRYLTETDNGTKNMNTVRSFFGTKLIDIEDNITINNISLKYTDYSGYQNYDEKVLGTYETEKTIDLTKLKTDNHTIILQTQDMFNIENNTKWTIEIDVREILKEYLFGKLKEARTFRSIKTENTLNSDINDSIYMFIENNIMDRYETDRVELYIKYDTLLSHDVFNKDLLQFTPTFKETVYKSEYIIKDFSLIKTDQFENLTPIKLSYSQTKKSSEFKFDYYFDIKFKKI